jgi:preprotein translocase subunit SecA
MERIKGDDDQARLRLLMQMSQGSKAYFDTRTHRQMRQVFTRLHYVHFAADLLKNGPTDTLEERVLGHLQQAQEAQGRLWQQAEATRLETGDLGSRIQNQIHRQVLLGAITELWVDYLTRVEALRVSIGLEAYAQRDPLVQYKSQASDMFQNLLGEIRSAVISRIFLFRPRLTTAQEETANRRSEPVDAPSRDAAQESPQESGKKRKRHRH